VFFYLLMYLTFIVLCIGAIFLDQRVVYRWLIATGWLEHQRIACHTTIVGRCDRAACYRVETRQQSGIFFCRCTTCFHFFLSADAWCCRPRRSGWFGFDWVGNCIFAKKILCAGHTITDTTWWSKNGTFLYTLTSWNIDRFSNFFNITWTILQLCEHHSIIYYCKVIAECFVVRAQELWNKSILFPDGLS